MEDPVRSFIKEDLNKDFIKINLNDIDAIHGNTISIKIVIPCCCQAHCPFCFNNQTIDTQMHNWDEFELNITNSLHYILSNLQNRKVTLDITGNEPTFSIENFKRFVDIIYNIRKIYSDKIEKVVITTNGFHLAECIKYMYPIIDIVNISLHHFDYLSRREIFGTKYIPSNEDLKIIIKNLNEQSITVSSVAVIYKQEDIQSFVKSFTEFSKEIGFKDTRIRFNFTTKDSSIRNQFYNKFTENEELVENKGLSVKYLNYNGYPVNLYLGVPDLIEYVIGVEMVIDDDGKLYIDYNKRFPINNVEIIKSFDKNVYIIK